MSAEAMPLRNGLESNGSCGCRRVNISQTLYFRGAQNGLLGVPGSSGESYGHDWCLRCLHWLVLRPHERGSRTRHPLVDTLVQ